MAHPLLVFDGECAFCRRSVSIMQRRIRRAPTAVPHQSFDEGSLAELGLTRAACTTAVQYVDSSGKPSAGAAAVARLFIHAGWPWRAVGAFMMLPGIRTVAARAYVWVADNRHRFARWSARSD